MQSRVVPLESDPRCTARQPRVAFLLDTQRAVLLSSVCTRMLLVYEKWKLIASHVLQIQTHSQFIESNNFRFVFTK